MKIHPYIESVSDEYLRTIADNYDYEGYMPSMFVRYLLSYLFYNFFKVEIPYDNTPFDKQFKALMEVVFINTKSSNKLEIAFSTLKKLSKRINYRKIEKAFESGAIFDFKLEHQKNYIEDVESLSNTTLELLDVYHDIDTDLNALELSVEIRKTIQFLSQVSNTFTPRYKEEILSNRYMRNYSEVTKVKKFKLKLPTFVMDFSLKRFYTRKITSKEVELKNVIIGVNCSATINSDDLHSLFKAILLHYAEKCKPGNTITLYFFANTIFEKIVLTSLTDIKSLLNKLLLRKYILYSGREAIVEFERMYQYETIVLISSIDLDVAITNFKNSYHAYTLVDSPNLKQLTLLSNGKYFDTSK